MRVFKARAVHQHLQDALHGGCQAQWRSKVYQYILQKYLDAALCQAQRPDREG